MISHLFHQVEKEVEAWLSLTATLLSRLVQNVAIVSTLRARDSKLKHIELLALQDTLALAVIVLYGAIVKQKLRDIMLPEGVITADIIFVPPRSIAKTGFRLTCCIMFPLYRVTINCNIFIRR